MDDAVFRSRCDIVGGMINRRKWSSAVYEARALVRDAPERAESFNKLNLASCLANPGAAMEHSPRLIDQARECEDVTDKLIGDMMRDRVIALIRMHTVDSLATAGDVIEDVKRLHANDESRLACIIGVEARLLFACGEYRRAAEAHTEADKIWRSIGNGADQQWMYNNYTHWLRSVIAVGYIRNMRMITQLVGLINTRCPEGAKKRTDEAAVMLLPFVGLRLYDWRARR